MHRQMRLAALAPVDPVRLQIRLVCVAHLRFPSSTPLFAVRLSVSSLKLAVRRAGGGGHDVGCTGDQERETRESGRHRKELRVERLQLGGDVWASRAEHGTVTELADVGGGWVLELAPGWSLARELRELQVETSGGLKGALVSGYFGGGFGRAWEITRERYRWWRARCPKKLHLLSLSDLGSTL